MGRDLDDPTGHGLDPKSFEAMDASGKLRVVPEVPAVVLTNPKYPHNIGQTVRALSGFGVRQLWWTGERALRTLEGMDRIPREERMRGYRDVGIYHHDRPLDLFPKDVTPVCIELVPGAEDLTTFVHPERAVYVFGPEDGGVEQGVRRVCHRFVVIPTKHCLNLSMAVGLVLYDREMKRRTDVDRIFQR